MKKIKLILQPRQFTSFTSYYLEDYWKNFFDIELYDSTKTYPSKSTLFVFWWANAGDELPIRLHDKGYKVAIDRLWEYPEGKTDFYWIEHVDWFRLNESLWWRALGYHQYRPEKTFSYRALVPMNKSRPARDLLYTKIKPLLDQCIWSYKGKTLPGDADKSWPEWQRFMNPEWYNTTYCSVVAETFTESIWPTEKSYKPIAFYHPFMTLSAPSHLLKLQSLGFETFDNIFNEEYDSLSDIQDRCRLIVSNVFSINMQQYDNETERKIKHNHEHFFDKSLVESIIEQEIINPLAEYAET